MRLVGVALTVAAAMDAVAVATGPRQASDLASTVPAVGVSRYDNSEEPGRQGLVAFTLIRGDRGDSYDMYVNSRACLRKAVPAFIDYADVAFHEGNVGLDVQMALRKRV